MVRSWKGSGKRIVVLAIRDEYDYMQAELIDTLKAKESLLVD